MKKNYTKVTRTTMPFETVPIKLTARQFEREMMTRYLTKEHKMSKETLNSMSIELLRTYYKLGQTIKEKYETKRKNEL